MTTDSQNLEILVAKIQQQLAPKAEVLHNVMLHGRLSNRKRQIDVLVREKIGQYEIQIVIDCKDYARPVDVKGVEEFYGLLTDVGAQKGVLVCPKGFSEAAKTRAEGLQIDLYSPVDTDAHKWRVSVTIPALCDFRSAAIGINFSSSAPVPFRLTGDIFSTRIISENGKDELGTPIENALKKWNAGQLPMDLGEHQNLSIFETQTILMYNGYGALMPASITASILVQRQLYFGQLPVPRISGFKDAFSGKIITNAFTVGMLDPDQVERDWQKLNVETEAPIKPVIHLMGLVGWGV